ncbi:MAG: Tat pathway signal protein, partial [Gemmatimonadetes bacterium]
EGMILNILALASPTHPADSAAWSAWVSGYQWGTYYGQSFVQFAPLFGHEYSHVWIDFRGIKDAYMNGRGIDYFENSRRAALSQRAYAIANPGGWRGYTANVWGLTACDGPANKTLTIG